MNRPVAGSGSCIKTHCWCGGKLQRFCHAGYGQCSTCGTLVALAEYSEKQLKNLYSQRYYWHEYQQKAGNYPDIVARSHSDFRDRIPVWYTTLTKYKPHFASMLEIGCSHGGFLEYCRQHGASIVMGVEVDAATCAFARERFNLQDVYSGLFPDVDLPYSQFDVICSFDVIEHFKMPIHGLKKMAELLHEEGIIFIQTPCYAGEGNDWYHLKPEEHLFLFGEESLRRLFMVCGLDIITLTPGYFTGDCFVIARKRTIKNILFIRTDTIGDAVLASSLLSPVKATFPEASITVLCQQHIAELYESSPFVTYVISFDFWKAYHNELYRSVLVMQMRMTQPDVVFNSQFSRELLNEYLALASGGKIIIGMQGDASEIDQAIRDADNKLYTLLINSPEKHKTELERHADFLRGMAIPAESLTPMVWLTEEDELFADSFFLSKQLSRCSTIALYPSGRHWQKYYPRYVEALDALFVAKDITLLLLGAKHEHHLIEELATKFSVRTVNCSGTLTLRQMAAILKRCRLGVGADTGTAHIACAVGTPNVVVLWGGHFGRFFPYSPLTSVVCLPLACYGCNWKCPYERWHCVADIQPTVLTRAVENALQSTSQKPKIYFQSPDAWHPHYHQPQWEMFEKFLDYRKLELVVVQ